jgi:ClpP class serine protease
MMGFAGAQPIPREKGRSPVRRYLLAAALCLVAAAPASADVRIRSSPGGEVVKYLILFELVRKSGERVIIDGPCLSACTLVLSIVPSERICVTSRAILGFHAARAVD